MKNWTLEQVRAISHPAIGKKSALVSAAAGSGKTAVLVERVIRLVTDIENPIDINKIVLVTFTRKAAAEMKQRLEKALQSLPDTPLVRRQIIRLEEAQITTINSFCLNLLRENGRFIGLEQGFKVADDEELELLAKKAMSAALEEFYNGGFSSEQVIQTCAFFGANGDSNLRRAVRDLYGFTRNIPDVQDWLCQQEKLYTHPHEYFSKCVPPYYELIKKDIANAIKLINESLTHAVCEKTVKSLKEELDFFEEYYGGYNCKITFPERRNTDKNEDDFVKELIKANRAKTKKVKDDIIIAAELISTFKEAIERLRPVIKVVVRLYRIYCEKFAEIKRINKVIDFPDSEHLCLQLLRSNKGVSERIKSEYELIIVDEFQDSNFLQYEIFLLLDSGRERLFFVGDIKQSIYRFRGADSGVFNAVFKNPEYEIIHLSKNFRSSNQVIEGVNKIFNGVMPDYDKNAWLKPGRGIDDYLYKTELCLLSPDDFPDMDGVHAEAEYTALRIKQMVSQGFEVFNRKCGYGDFAVLSSAGAKNFNVYEKVFREHGVPCVSAGTGGYLKTEEVGLALDLLMVINNPYNDLSLFNIMMSPLYGFTAEEIAVCRAGRKDKPLYSAIMGAERDADVTFNNKLKNFVRSIARYRRIADVSSVSELIAVINGEGGFLPLIIDSNKRANLRLLSYYAERFAQIKTDSSLTSFLTYIKDLKDIDADVKQANVNFQAEGSVRLMTIHAAKGLEFPVCFVARINQEFNFKAAGDFKKTPLMRFDKVAGLVADCFDEQSLCRFKTLHSDYAGRLNRELTIEEEKRKLYVAVTRAECKLIFTGFAKEEKVHENSYLQWIIDNVEMYKGERIRLNNVKSKENLQCAIDDNSVNEIIENISAEYPRRRLGTIPKKLTATQVGVEHCSRENEYDEPSVFPRNPSFHGLRRLTGKKRGDAYHKAMELIDFYAGNYKIQLQKFEPHFTQIEYKAVNPSDILGFFESELGKRAVNSEKVIKEYKLYTEIELYDLGIEEDFSVEKPAAGSMRTRVLRDKPFVQGIADMFFYEDGDIVLVDYKTNRNTSEERLINDYKGQLALYKKAIEEMTGVRVKECWLYSFEIGEILLTFE